MPDPFRQLERRLTTRVVNSIVWQRGNELLQCYEHRALRNLLPDLPVLEAVKS